MQAPRLASYQLIRKIAAGGMAEIFLARQYGAGGFFRDVVIKRLFPHLADNERQLRMFQDEGRLLSQLSHPNIPQVYEVGQKDGHWYIAMEYVHGMNVADVWRLGAKAGQLMPLNVALAVVLQACEALHHAHERKDRAGRALRIVHRDVTPQNIMLTRDGVAKLMDFGVAATSARKDTENGAVRGTFSYMAPEQVRGKPLDKRADVFALGVVLYELTTGTRLFRGTDVQVMTQVVEQEIPTPSSRVPEYPADLEEIVLSALARDRGARVPSAAHLATYIEEFAMRSGLLIGPRAAARYFATVVPMEPIREEELAMVAPEEPEQEPRPRLEVVTDSEAKRIWGPDAEEPLPVIDEKEVLDDLQLLAGPVEPHTPRVPIKVEPLSVEPLPLDQVGMDIDVEDLDDIIDNLPPAVENTKPTQLELENSKSLVLDGFHGEEAPAERPVVLLDQRARKDPTGSTRRDAPNTAVRSGAEYVDELERRLARESGDGKKKS
jgi:serine/threonine protein kinase